jgi:hypothetical protein
VILDLAATLTKRPMANQVRTRIVREIEYLKQLKHPHIIKL